MAGTQRWLLAGAAAVLACALIQVLAARLPAVWLPVALVPLALGLAVGAAQVVPWDAATLGWLSPKTVQLNRELLAPAAAAEAALPQKLAVAVPPSTQTVSLYPAATRRELAVWVFGVSMFVAGAVYFRTPAAWMTLCGVIAVHGAALAFVELAFLVRRGADWRMHWPTDFGPLGPFINRNHDGAYLNLCLAGAVGWLLWSLGNRWSFSRQRFEFRMAGAASAAMLVGGVLCTHSRGAAVAMGLAGLLVTLVAFALRRGMFRMRWLAVPLAAGIALVAWVGMSQSLQARLQTLGSLPTALHARWSHWRDAVHAVPDFWHLGSGLGTYGYVYPLYQRHLDRSWFKHAENHYLEACVEGGLPGLALPLAAAALVGLAGGSLLRSQPGDRTFAFALAAGFALTTMLLQSAIDFAACMPANAGLLGLWCGALAGGATQRRLARANVALRWGAARRLVSAVAIAALLAACVWGQAETARAAAVAPALRGTYFDEPSPRAPASYYVPLIERITHAVRACDDAEAHLRLAQLWIDRYQAQALARLHEENVPGEDQQLWRQCGSYPLHALLHQFARATVQVRLAALRVDPLVQENLWPALRHALTARNICPLLPEPHLILAQLSGLAAPPAEDAVHAERVRRLAPADDEFALRCGILEAQAGRTAGACRDWRRSLELSAPLDYPTLETILTLADAAMPAWQIVEELLPDVPEVLERAAREHYAGAGHATTREALAARLESLLRDETLLREGRLTPATRWHYQGTVCELRGQAAEAAAAYRAALAQQPDCAAWHYELAELLAGQGQWEEAHLQAVQSARAEPENRRYRTLLERINHARITGAGATAPAAESTETHPALLLYEE